MIPRYQHPKNKENTANDTSLVYNSSRPDQESKTSRTPVKILPTFIFSLNSSNIEGQSLNQSSSKKRLFRNSSSKKSLKSLKSSKSSKTPMKPVQSKSILTENSQKHPKKFKAPSNIKKLIKAINEHCCSCQKFREELKKKDLFLL